jgi:hypothetical protein
VKEERITMVEKKAEEATETSSWIEIGGDYRGRYDYLKGTVHDYWQFVSPTSMPVFQPGYDVKNDSLMTNRLGLNLKAKATEDIQVKVRLLMYKTWGAESIEPVGGSNAYFADKFFLFDGNVGHIPESNLLQVDQAYATWSNIADAPVWFSVGRRPSTGGLPSNIRMNAEKTGTAGVPALMVDYAFDGATIGVAPDIEALPGAYAKVCYGKGFDSGFRTPNNSLKDVNFLGVNVVPYDTDNLHIEAQWDRAFDIFAFPEHTFDPAFGPNANIGDVDQYGVTISGKLPELGPGDLNLFATGAISVTHPNGNTFGGFAGLLEDCPGGVCPGESHTGGAIYLGARYDFTSSGTKIGLEYNHGSKNWISFDPGNDDIWTGKLGAHGNVYESYVIQELNWLKPISKRGKAFFRLGYQYYDFEYTGSSNWVGAPKMISELNNPMNAQLLPPIEKAHDLYFTFDVTF